jgi:LPS-assembly lipoprotein
VLSLGLAGCGFQPLHRAGAGGAGSDGSAATMSSIRIAPIADRAGQHLRNLLLDRITPLGAPAAPRYVLQVQLAEARREFALRSDETPTRVTLSLTATFALSPVGRAQVFRGGAISANGYNVLQSEFATLAAERDARRRALAILSEEISLRVAAALHNPAMFKMPAATAAP